MALPDGRRALAVVEVPMTALAAIIAQAGGSPGLGVTLEREDGQLLATVPSGAGLRAHEQAPPLSDEALRGGPVLAPSRLTGVPAIVAVRPTLYRSLRVTVSLPLADALLAWQQNRNIIVAASLALIALTLIGGVLSQWQFNRLADARAALARSVETLDQALAVMPDGFLLCDTRRPRRALERALPRDGAVGARRHPRGRAVRRAGDAGLVETPMLDATPEERAAWLRGAARSCTAPATATGSAISATAWSCTSIDRRTPRGRRRQRVPRRHRGRAPARAGQGERRGGQPGEVAVPRDDEPRDPHAAERGAGPQRADAAFARSTRSSAATPS